MANYRLALIGFGGVNRALAKLIRDENENLAEALGYSLEVVAITDLALGTVINNSGVDLDAALAVPRGENFAHLNGGSADAENRRAILESNADVIVEATYTNPIDGEPASTHIRWALEAGKHVTTTNKGPIALHRAELLDLSRATGARFEYEGTVMSGTPVIRFARELLAGTTIDSFAGILNGTSNYILGRMEQGLELKQAISEAQELGYAEADPIADIGGSDVRLKVSILASELFGTEVSSDEVSMSGIQDITGSDISSATAAGNVLKLIGRASRDSAGTVSATVEVEALDKSHPLAGVSGPTNAVSFHTDLLGGVTVSGPGAGVTETAYALLSDITAIHKSLGGTE